MAPTNAGPDREVVFDPDSGGKTRLRSGDDAEVVFDPDSGGQTQPRQLDSLIAELAARQHGVVARSQLRTIGLGRRAIDHRLERGRLHSVHRGVYAVGHRLLMSDGRWMAAVLAGGDGAVLSHRSAAALWKLRSSSIARFEITVPARRRAKGSVEQHRSVLAPDEVTRVCGIPVTTVARTLLDLAAVVDRDQLRRAAHEAEVLRLWDGHALAGSSSVIPVAVAPLP